MNQVADAFVCGSDVIWNSNFNYNLGTFYLDFAEKYKFSYAGSFGKKNVNEKEIKQMRKYLPDFNEISCREKSGCDTIKKYTGLSTVIVSDPVLLLRRADWNELVSTDLRHNKYIFVYVTHLNETVKLFIKKLHEKTGLAIKYSACGPKQALQLRVLQVQKPERWLQLIRDAEFVITNSFHGTAFCTIFHKKFFTVVYGEKEKGINTRMYEFLHSIGLEDRIINEVPDKFDLSEIDYAYTDKIIEIMRSDSIAFIRRNLEAAYKEKCEHENEVI